MACSLSNALEMPQLQTFPVRMRATSDAGHTQCPTPHMYTLGPKLLIPENVLKSKEVRN